MENRAQIQRFYATFLRLRFLILSSFLLIKEVALQETLHICRNKFVVPVQIFLVLTQLSDVNLHFINSIRVLTFR